MTIATDLPDSQGHFGPYGGRYVPETLMAPLEELEQAFHEARRDAAFQAELDDLLKNFAGRPTPLYEARRLARGAGRGRACSSSAKTCCTPARTRSTTAWARFCWRGAWASGASSPRPGAGQHGVATATVCALFGLECVVYMGEEDMRRQRLNVFRMRLLGAKVVGVNSGSRTLKDAVSEAMRDWVTNVSTTHYLLGSALGAHPYPLMVREFHRCTGDEARAQMLERTGRLPDVVLACVGGGSNAIGIFTAFIADAQVRLVGVEAGGRGLSLGEHAARFAGGSPGVLQGAYSYLLQGRRRAGFAHAFGVGWLGLRAGWA